MIVKKDVFDHKNRLLLNKGVEISHRHLRILKTWGVNLIDIEDSIDNNQSPSSSDIIDPDIYRKARQKADFLFKFNKLTRPLEHLLFNICVQKIAEKNSK